MYLLLVEASLYPFSENFVCFDGSATIAFENINDNYCDCPDGSDEPGLCVQYKHHVNVVEALKLVNCIMSVRARCT